MDTIHTRLGANVKNLRLHLGWTQAKLAEKVEITPTFMMHIEHGTRGVSLETVELLANALGVDIPDLFKKVTSEQDFKSNHEYLLKNLETILTRKLNLAVQESIEEVHRA